MMTLGRRLAIVKNRWWWTAWSPDAPTASFEGNIYVRSRTREGVVEKACRKLFPEPRPVEYIYLPWDDDDGP